MVQKGKQQTDETGAIKPANLFGFSEKKNQVEDTVRELLDKTFG